MKTENTGIKHKHSHWHIHNCINGHDSGTVLLLQVFKETSANCWSTVSVSVITNRTPNRSQNIKGKYIQAIKWN